MNAIPEPAAQSSSCTQDCPMSSGIKQDIPSLRKRKEASKTRERHASGLRVVFATSGDGTTLPPCRCHILRSRNERVFLPPAHRNPVPHSEWPMTSSSAKSAILRFAHAGVAACTLRGSHLVAGETSSGETRSRRHDTTSACAKPYRFTDTTLTNSGGNVYSCCRPEMSTTLATKTVVTQQSTFSHLTLRSGSAAEDWVQQETR